MATRYELDLGCNVGSAEIVVPMHTSAIARALASKNDVDVTALARGDTAAPGQRISADSSAA